MKLQDLSIIQYQNVSPTPDAHRLWLSIDAFKEQLEYLASHDFAPLSIDQALDIMEGIHTISNGRPIALTFDNGFRDFHEYVLPLLLKYDFPSTLLIDPLRVGQTMTLGSTPVDYLSWKDLREIIQEGLVTVGAYEDEALNINQLPLEKVREHVVSYKKILEDKLGTKVHYFGVKEGVPERSIRDLLISQGYRAFLTQCPTNRRLDLYSIGRIQVDDPDFNIFLTKISQTYLFFKDKRVWRYIRRYKLDRVGHRISESYDRLRGKKTG